MTDPPLRSALPYNACMLLEEGMVYRAGTAAGHRITFTVIDAGGNGVWPTVDLKAPDGMEPNVWLNTGQLLWISAEAQQAPILEAAERALLETPVEAPE